SAKGSGEAKKMAKSGEDFITLQTLKEKGIHPLAYRYYLLQAHYRSPINFSFEAVQSAQNAYFNMLKSFSSQHSQKVAVRITPDIAEWFSNFTCDDLDTPSAISLLRKVIDDRELDQHEKLKTVGVFDSVLGLDIENQSKKLAEEMAAVPKEITEKAARRSAARQAKNFAEADALRAEIEQAGFEIMDTDAGPLVRRKLN
ncbi:MAG: hypothetical protein Q7R88_00260, partial [bacterium]|nr:hypothetical protein [bacterium]